MAGSTAGYVEGVSAALRRTRFDLKRLEEKEHRHSPQDLLSEPRLLIAMQSLARDWDRFISTLQQYSDA